MKLDVIYNEDCLVGMQRMPSCSVDMILCDLPYGTTACRWDSIIPFEPLWEQYKRVVKHSAAICLFGSEPFSSNLRMSNSADYKYDWYWDKKFGGNFVQAKRMPLKSVESISVFNTGDTMPRYFPIMEKRAKPMVQGGTRMAEAIPIKNNADTHSKRVYTEKYPVTLLPFPRDIGRTVHPTQKPVPLFEYLIRTYTKSGEVVLDNCMGSGTTAIACINSGRRFIGFEKDHEYCAKAERRIFNHIAAAASKLTSTAVA